VSALELTLDGAACLAEEGRTVLEVATGRGVRIPTLCHDPRVTPESACWVCLVEVRRGDRWEPVPACSTRVEQGMVVRTESPEIEAGRRWALQLLLSDHWADCVAPCVLACPAHIDIPGYIADLRDGDAETAVARIREANPLPGVCGRVCPHRCEDVCRRGLADEPVAINHLKRLATSKSAPPRPDRSPPTGQSVAIIGAGPAGLTAAYYLALQGHAVTVLDAHEHPGGMLRHGIPAYRLPRAVLETEIAVLDALGVRLQGGWRLGRDGAIGDLSKAGHGAVLLALGAWKSRRLAIPGEDAPGVLAGVEFLRRANVGEVERVDGRVVVVGGGNTAIDAARVALRLGAAAVTIAYRRTRDQMPAFGHEVDDALAEGVRLESLVAPVAIETSNGAISAVVLQRMELAEADRSGRPRPVPVQGSELTEPADLLLTAVGEVPEHELLGEDLPARGPVAHPMTLGTDVDGVFAAGDFVSGPSTAIDAIASGRRAARAIGAWLADGEAHHPPEPVLSRRDVLSPETPEDLEPVQPRHRAPMPARAAADCVRDFDEVEQGYGWDAASDEAARCLQCGCDAYDSCKLRQLADEHGADPSELAGEAQRLGVGWLRPGIRVDLDKCIRCGRCVRICRELAGVSAIEFVHRGFATLPIWALARGDAARDRCDACLGSDALCVDTCPTGALTLASGGED